MLFPRTLTILAESEPVEVSVRPITDGDSIAELTDFLHRSYRVLADMGLRFFATHQTEEQTRERIANGLCLLALNDERVIGTIFYCDPARSGGTGWYDRPDVAYFGQFAVEPSLRRCGLGRMLLEIVEEIAREDGAAELGLDTAETAHHLISYYGSLGYRHVTHVQWDVTNYRSVIMSKRLSPGSLPTEGITEGV
jgi:GNAT superfamily N-acetyltransferase